MTSQSLEHLEPQTLAAPAVEAVVDGRVRPVLRRTVPHRAPIFSMCTMPEITRRSSTRCAPLRPRGSKGSIRAHSASLNQVSCLAIQHLRQMTALNQRTPNRASLLSTDP